MKKGALELCVLALLSRRDCYGFELVSALSEGVSMSEGTIYPLLKRLREDALLTTYLRESTEGPPRKYYHITKKGIDTYRAMLDEWCVFRDGVERTIARALVGEIVSDDRREGSNDNEP